MTERNEKKPIGILRTDQTRFVMYPQWDLQNLLAAAGVNDLPVMFSNRSDLDQWCKGKQIEQQSLPGISNQEAIRCFADHYDGMTNIVYDFVWVLASSKRYRDAIHAKWKAAGEETTMRQNVHVDHVVNRGSLRHFRKARIDPWLMLCEVPDGANTGYGSKVERGNEQPTDMTVVNLTPLMLFKLLGVDFPSNRTQADRLLEKCKEKLGEAKDWFDQMKTEVHRLFPNS